MTFDLEKHRQTLSKSEIPANWRNDLPGMVLAVRKALTDSLDQLDLQASQIATLKAAMLEAAKEAGYVERLESEYLEAKKDSLISSHNADDILFSNERAQAALTKIREGPA